MKSLKDKMTNRQLEILETMAAVRDLWRLLVHTQTISDRRIIAWQDATDFAERRNKVYAVYDMSKRTSTS